MSDVTHILKSVPQGDPSAGEKLLLLFDGELWNPAAGEPAGHTLQPTALVHEAWLRPVRIQAQP